MDNQHGCVGILHEEVLTNIFKYLPLSDRKNVRLTCTLWNVACHHPMIVKREKFRFHPGVTREDMGAYITNCRTLRSDFEFYAIPRTQFKQIPSILWTECGERITSLCFNECVVDKETVKNVLLYCPNLISLRVILRKSNQKESSDILKLSTMLDELISLEVRRENLVSLELFTWEFLPVEDLEKLFQIHPKIRTFRQKEYWEQRMYKDIFSFCGDCDYSELAHTYQEPCPIPTKDFIFHWRMNVEWVKSFNPNVAEKFKELAIRISYAKEEEEGEEEELLRVDMLDNFFSNQTELEELTLGVFWKSKFSIIFVLRILKKLSKLKVLKFYLDYHVRFEVAEYLEFINSVRNLESLQVLSFRLNRLDSMAFSLLSSSLEFINLKTLKLGDTNNDLVLHILRRCSSLSKLRLERVLLNDPILQAIFKRHTKLKKLSLYCQFYNCSIAGFTGRKKLPGDGDYSRSPYVGYAFRRLQDLEHLKLSTDGRNDDSEKIVTSFLTEFDFPRLKNFLFYGHISSENERRLLNTVSTMAPCLETLKIEPAYDGIKMDLLLKCCKKMKQLKWLEQVNSASVDLYEQLFTECPSLVNVFIYQNRRQTSNSPKEEIRGYFYDRVKKTLIPVGHYM